MGTSLCKVYKCIAQNQLFILSNDVNRSLTKGTSMKDIAAVRISESFRQWSKHRQSQTISRIIRNSYELNRDLLEYLRVQSNSAHLVQSLAELVV